MNLKLFREVLSSKENEYPHSEEGSPKIEHPGYGRQLSICDLISCSKMSIEQKIFMIINGDDQGSHKRYVQIKFKKFHMNNQEK
jgi:hypothetical protein